MALNPLKTSSLVEKTVVGARGWILDYCRPGEKSQKAELAKRVSFRNTGRRLE
jgi:hypothetical protein